MKHLGGVLLLFAVLSAPLARAEIEWGTVAGKVTDSELNPIADAVVRLVRDGNVVQSARTDEAGEYTIEQIPPGRHRISTDKTGFKPTASTAVSVKANETLWYNPTIDKK